MIPPLRTLLALAVAAVLCASLAARAQTPSPAPAVPVPAPILPPAEVPVPKPAAPAKPAAKSALKPAAKKTEAKKSGGAAFSGSVTDADKVNYTLTLTKARVLQVTSETRFFKAGKPAVFDDVVVGDEVSGQQQQGKDGQWEALAVHLGAKGTAPIGGKKTEPKPVEKKPFTE